MVPFILLYKLIDIYYTMKKLFDKAIIDIQNSKQKRQENGSSKKQKNKKKKNANAKSTEQNQTATGQQSNSSNLTSNIVESQRLLSGVVFENAIHTTPEIFDSINKYRGILSRAISVGQGPPGNTGKTEKRKKQTTTKVKGKEQTKTVDVEVTIDDKNTKRIIYETVGAPSLFNPYYGVQAVGITSGVPLLDTQTGKDKVSAKTNIDARGKDYVINGTVNIGRNINDCSIANLVNLSKHKFSTLGHAKYKYTDFMYCKEVGKISNNHLITLRKFAAPVGDNIFAETAMSDDTSNLAVMGDVGRLVTWFGTEDNKLEDIFHYSYHSTWKTLEAKIEEKQSQESAAERGVMGGLVNLFSPGYNNATAKGIAPSALSLLLGSSGSDPFLTSAPYADNPAVNGAMYDKNRVYEPQDTIRNMEIPEGKLEFSHEFSLVFNYKLRGYQNINAKSALLDLIGNIMAVTYKQGTFWPGEQRIIGAPPNTAGWKKVENFKNDAWAAGGSFITNLLNGDSFGDAANGLLSGLSNAINNNFGIDLSSISSFADLGAVAKGIIDKAKGAGFGAALKGMVSNQLGRPAVYAFDSLLTGDNSGLWHVTIGNPLNPIAVMGNLILTNAEISHSGPLGLDDFPTDLKVTVSLKHARPRDSVDIQRMYTMGRTAIYGKISSTECFKIDSFAEKDEVNTPEANKQEVGDGGILKSTITIGKIDLIDGNIENEAIGWIGESDKRRFKTNKGELK